MRLRTAIAIMIGFLAPAVVAAQTATPVTSGPILTPEVQLGSGSTPTIITNPPIVEVGGTEPSLPPSEPQASNAPPASTALLSTRHFDYIVSPVQGVMVTPSESMAGSVPTSLGEYARELRAQKQNALKHTAPNAMGQPSK